jgi:hypothetical protein
MWWPMRLSKGHVTKSGQLREASVASWAGQYTGLTEVRDLREVMTLANIMDSINRREMAQAMDVLSQRIVAIQLAKRKGGSWDKAELVELVPSGNTVGTSSTLALVSPWKARRAFSRLSETQGDPADFGGYLQTFLVAVESALASVRSVSPFFRYWHCSKYFYQYILDEGLSMSSVCSFAFPA